MTIELYSATPEDDGDERATAEVPLTVLPFDAVDAAVASARFSSNSRKAALFSRNLFSLADADWVSLPKPLEDVAVAPLVALEPFIPFTPLTPAEATEEATRRAEDGWRNEADLASWVKLAPASRYTGKCTPVCKDTIDMM